MKSPLLYAESMMPRFLSNIETFMVGICLILGLCLTSGAKAASPSPSYSLSQPPGTALIQGFIQDMQAGKIHAARYGFPFWLDSRWVKDEQTLNTLFSEGARQRPFPAIRGLHVEIHPLSTLEVKSPKAWAQLSLKGDAAFLKKTRLAVVFFEIEKEGQLHNEESWLLVQPVEPIDSAASVSHSFPNPAMAWQLVGLMER